ncbi:MAG TPA: toll/interleukin-1 receptor domain-containing protein [Methylomirabilota bacterium]|nr:toll/interleukin-1 receptor domain-containing protein [Methylomirabilota bacterium]
MQNSFRTKTFVSYCHSDAKYLKRLRVHLASFGRDGLLDVWDDMEISPGELWQEEINKALLCARVAILLVSADFLASGFITSIELPSLLAASQSDDAVILPVILSPCSFADSELSRFQAVNNPSKPLTSMNFNDKEMVWVRVAETVKNVMRTIKC